MNKKYVVVKPIKVTYGSHTRNFGGTHWKMLAPGCTLVFDGENMDGEVWFIDPCGERGKVALGSISAMLKRGEVAEKGAQ